MGIRLEGEKNVLERLQARSATISPESPALRAVLIRIAALVNSRAALNIRKEQMVLTGRLLNSFKYEFYEKGKTVGVYVGSFGVPYAHLMEEGGEYSHAMRKAMFANLRKAGKLNGKGKGFLRGSVLRGRPFLRPAFEQSKQRIIDMLLNEVSK